MPRLPPALIAARVPAKLKPPGTPAVGYQHMIAAVVTMAGVLGEFPTKYVLDKLGAELRRLYGPVLDETPPKVIASLVAQLPS